MRPVSFWFNLLGFILLFGLFLHGHFIAAGIWLFVFTMLRIFGGLAY